MRIIVLTLYLVTTNLALARETLSGLAYVTRIKDEDTFVARLDEGRMITIRSLGIDAPESGQPDGPEARDAFKLLADGPLALECPNKDWRGAGCVASMRRTASTLISPS